MSFSLFPVLRDASDHYQPPSDPLPRAGPCVPCYATRFPSLETIQQHAGARPFVFAIGPPAAAKGLATSARSPGAYDAEDGSYHLTDSGAASSSGGCSPFARGGRPRHDREEPWRRARESAWSPFHLSPFVLCPTHPDVLLVRAAPLTAAAALHQHHAVLAAGERRALEAAAAAAAAQRDDDEEDGRRAPPEEAAPRYTEVVALARYDVVGTSYAVERYQLLLVADLRPPPAAARGPAQPPVSAAAAAVRWLRLTEGELLARLPEDGGAVLTARHVCRCLARTGGSPLDHEAALAQLYAGGAEAGPPPSAATMERRFYDTALPLLGCDEAHRQRCWERLAQLKEDRSPRRRTPARRAVAARAPRLHRGGRGGRRPPAQSRPS
ncbi:hypothetical protein STCU_10329 [Strigomonas culicis]|uniref:Uncharacterized protein n=1 Tax=Strigomonas culicis TaxID=28005 RepID=S9UTL8_9TRYP|nr:hypothetical protein STCU_10329 [Strigomonas culicis]|eukprot:EPY17901.1 hypothetical protein STCU_10329 [Strigomonas culicis]